jgi:hypothetical protein
MELPEHISVTFGASQLFTLHLLLEMALSDNDLLERDRHPDGAAMLKRDGYRVKFMLDEAIKAAGYKLGAPPDEDLDDSDKKFLKGS